VLTPVGGTPLPLAEPARLHTTGDAARDAGITYRQLDHWIRRGYVTCIDRGPAATTGTPRRLTPEQLHRVRLLAALVAAGLDPARAAHLLDAHLSGHDTFTAPLAPGVAVVVNLPDPRGAVA